MNSGELIYCPSCEKNKPRFDFLDRELISGIGRTCMQCKGKPAKKKKRKKRATSTKSKKLWTGKSCRVCTRHLVEGDNWAPSRVKRHDYICSSCRSNKRKITTAKKTSSSSGITPDCPKCNSKMMKRYSSKYSREFWGCSKFPSCRGTRDA